MGNGYRAWCFTLNNPSDEDTASLPTQASSKWPHVHQCVYQLESGANGTPHYQGYVRFTLQKTLNVVRGYLPRAHWAQARGNAQQNYEYCTKRKADWESLSLSESSEDELEMTENAELILNVASLLQSCKTTPTFQWMKSSILEDLMSSPIIKHPWCPQRLFMCG